jgi:predicted O-linked N-acetylglucosamine transferase (SPINDLY family)
MALARKPVPVQVTFAGYPGTTGLQTIDYRLTDPYLDPPGQNDADYVEQSIRLPDSFWCYDPVAMSIGLTAPPDIGPLPARSAGHITFGCLNNFCKVNDGVLALWARVLLAVPTSQLLLSAQPGVSRQRVLARLAREGIEQNRVQFTAILPREQYLRQYHRIDVGLDTLPYNGHTTSLDAIWMGVPVVTLVGQTVVGRAGLSQCSNLGLKELVADTPEQFVQIAANLAGDLDRLEALLTTLRARMLQSPLTDAVGFTRNIEAAYRQMWRSWCADR